MDGRKLVGLDKWSNVAWGYVNTENGKTVIFTYQDHPSALNAPVRVTLKSLKKSTSDSKQSLNPISSGSSTYIFTPSGPVTKNALDPSYHEINLDTIGGFFDVSVKLEANGYVTGTVTAGRFEGNIRTMKITNGNVLKSGNSFGFSAEEPTFTYSEDSGKCKVTFREIAEDPKGYVVLAAGGTYEMTVSSENDGQYLMYVDMHFRTDKGVEYLPESVELLDGDGTITHYPGDKFHYVMNTTTRMQSDVKVKLKASEDHDIQLDQMWVKSFNRSAKTTGGFYENAVKIDL